MEESNPNPIPPPEAAPAPPSEQPPPPAEVVAQPPAESQSPPLANAAPQPTFSSAAMPPPPSAPEAMPPPPPPSAAAAPPPPKSKKRPLESNVQIQDCSYFKMRAVLKDMRPHLLEVVKTVDFRDCKAADEVRERLKLFMLLYKQLTAEAVTNKKSKISQEEQKLSNQNGARQKPQEQDVKTVDQPPQDSDFAKPPEEQSCYIGGSAFGWNFITYVGSKSVYYGRSKESFRAAQATS